MKEKELNRFLEDMSLHSEFKILEEGKDDDEIKKVVKKRGLAWPSPELAFFRSIYAFVDRTNLNNCNLPRVEVEAALSSIVSKPIDFDHMRRRIVGHYLDARVEDDKIITVGVFYKDNLKDDYEVVKDLVEKHKLSTSFEAYGKRVYRKDGTYDLTEISFAGGGLLLDSDPAFVGADVLEMSNKERVLEFAKVMTPPETYVRFSEEGKSEREFDKSRYCMYDVDRIYQAISEVENLDGEHKGAFEILSVDFVKNQVKVRDIYTDGELLIDLTPKAIVTKKGKVGVSKVEDLTAVSTIDDMNQYIQAFKGSDEELEILIEKSSEGPRVSYTDRLDLTDEDFAAVKQLESKKIRLFPIPDLATINNVEDRLGQDQVKATLDKLGITIDNVERKISRRKKEIAMKQLIEKIQKSSVEEVLREIAKSTLERELTEAEFEKAYSLVVLTEPKGDANDTSLLKVPGRKSSANETSLINAEVTEDTFKDAIKEVIKDTEEAKKLAEKEAIEKAEAEKVAAEAKAKEEAELKIKEEAEAVAKKEQEEADARKKAIEEAETEKDKQIATLTDELAKAAKQIEELDKAMKDRTVSERKEKLGEFAKDMKDEDILDETKFTIAMKDKEIAELKATKKTEPVDFTKGSNDKGPVTPEDEARKKVDEYAWGELKDK